jgi:hypothetical protein
MSYGAPSSGSASCSNRLCRLTPRAAESAGAVVVLSGNKNPYWMMHDLYFTVSLRISQPARFAYGCDMHCERPSCQKCRMNMVVVSGEPLVYNDYATSTFECLRCGHVERPAKAPETERRIA